MHNNPLLASLQCGRAFDPNFLFLWPNARVSMTAPGHASSLLPHDGEQEEDLNRALMEESSAFYSTGRLWDDGIILPQHTRKVKQDAITHAQQLECFRTLQSQWFLFCPDCRFLLIALTSSLSSSTRFPQRKLNRHCCVCESFCLPQPETHQKEPPQRLHLQPLFTEVELLLHCVSSSVAGFNDPAHRWGLHPFQEQQTPNGHWPKTSLE